MCFSFQADLAAGAVIAPIGVVTLLQVRHRGELLIGALPALFALHQLTESLVWAGFDGRVSDEVAEAATRVYLVFAQAVLPVLVPLGMYLLEPVRDRRRHILPFVVLGALVGAYLLVVSGVEPISARREDRLVVYDTALGIPFYVAVAYVAATCAPALLQSERYLREFGAVNLAGVAIAGVLAASAFASVWCVYAALASVLVLLHFRRQRALDSSHPLGTGRREAALAA